MHGKASTQENQSLRKSIDLIGWVKTKPLAQLCRSKVGRWQKIMRRPRSTWRYEGGWGDCEISIQTEMRTSVWTTVVRNSKEGAFLCAYLFGVLTYSKRLRAPRIRALNGKYLTIKKCLTYFHFIKQAQLLASATAMSSTRITVRKPINVVINWFFGWDIHNAVQLV